MTDVTLDRYVAEMRKTRIHSEDRRIILKYVLEKKSPVEELWNCIKVSLNSRL
jgi:hypothetical protein